MNECLLSVSSVMEILDCKKAKAYEIIRLLNKELKQQGFIVVRGRVPRSYLFSRCGIQC